MYFFVFTGCHTIRGMMNLHFWKKEIKPAGYTYRNSQHRRADTSVSLVNDVIFLSPAACIVRIKATKPPMSPYSNTNIRERMSSQNEQGDRTAIIAVVKEVVHARP